MNDFPIRMAVLSASLNGYLMSKRCEDQEYERTETEDESRGERWLVFEFKVEQGS